MSWRRAPDLLASGETVPTLYTGGLKLIGKGVTFSLELDQGRLMQVWMHPGDLMCADLPQMGNPAVDDQRLLEKPRLPAKGPRDAFFCSPQGQVLGSRLLLQDATTLQMSRMSEDPSLLYAGPAM